MDVLGPHPWPYREAQNVRNVAKPFDDRGVRETQSFDIAS